MKTTFLMIFRERDFTLPFLDGPVMMVPYDVWRNNATVFDTRDNLSPRSAVTT
jgi:hypothetical protein